MFKKVLLAGFVSILLLGQSIPISAATVTSTTISDVAGLRWSDTLSYSIHISSNKNTITSIMSVVAFNTNTFQK